MEYQRYNGCVGVGGGGEGGVWMIYFLFIYVYLSIILGYYKNLILK